MKFKEYEMPDGRKAVFEYDENGVGKITLECMDELMSMIADRPQGEVDAIDRDALIDYCLKLIDVERKQGSDAMNYGQERVNQTEAIIDYIEHMPHLYADRPQEWIPCSERLPKAEEKVWIQTERGKVCFAMYEDGTISEDDSAWHWYDLPFDKWDEENDCGIIPEGWWEWTEFHPDNEFDCPVDEEVVAWMPIPKPWKGADDE